MPVSKLTKARLQNQTFPHVTVPDASVFSLPEKVLQFGTGVLLRGLPDFFIDQANRRGVFNGRVVMVKSTDAGSADAFADQDNLYTLVERGIDRGKAVEEFTVIASISRTLSARTQWNDILQCARNPAMQVILSNTTEVGIQLTDDDVRQSPPESFPGKLTAFLYERFRAFNGSAASGMVIVPCELIVDNGIKLKEIVMQLAAQNGLEPAFTEWLHQHNAFCNSLVDRIVPGKPDPDELHALKTKLGYTDDRLTVSEVYQLWAIEGEERVKNVLSFHAADRGVIIAPDITPYRERKLRLLNGTHTISVALGFLCGFDTVGDCLHDPPMATFIREVMHREIVPTVPVDEASARQFADDVLDRFRNPYIVHPLINIAWQYSSKMAMRNVPTLQRYHSQFTSAPPLMALGFAAYVRFMKSVNEEAGTYYGERNGQLYPIRDNAAAYFHRHWQSLQMNKSACLRAFTSEIAGNVPLWGTDLNDLPGFVDAVTGHLHALLTDGAPAALQRLLANA